VKWKYLLSAINPVPTANRFTIKIDQSKREKELKQSILTMAKELTVWIDNATAIAVKGEVNEGMSETERVLSHILKYRENEGQYYNRLIQMVGLHTELCLISVNDDVEEIVSTIEQKWLNWLSTGRSIENHLENRLEHLLVNEERKNQFKRLLAGTEWFEMCVEALGSEPEFQTRTRMRIESEKLRIWSEFLEAHHPLQRNFYTHMQLTIIEHLKSIYSSLHDPIDRSLTISMRDMELKWKKLYGLLESRNALLSAATSQLEEQEIIRKLIHENEEAFISWISLRRQFVVANLNQSADIMKEAILQIEREMDQPTEMIRLLREGADDLELVENHWSTFQFMLDRFKRRADELADEETARRDKVVLYGSKCATSSESLRAAIKRLATTNEPELLLQIYGVMQTIMIDFNSQGDLYDPQSESTEIFLNDAIDAYATFDEIWTERSSVYAEGIKNEGITSAYYRFFACIAEWESQQQVSLEDIDSRIETIHTVSSTLGVLKSYFAQRPLITSLYQQMSGIWSKMSQMGIVLNRNLKTPLVSDPCSYTEYIGS
jgi:hypothetical protein